MTTPQSFHEEVELQGHIIDSLLLPKVLDEILTNGGTFVIKEVKIGERQADPSFARIEVRADSPEKLQKLLEGILEHGAVPTNVRDCATLPADLDGWWPEGLCCTASLRTQVGLHGEWIEGEDQEMDCGILVDPAGAARCAPMTGGRRGDRVVVGHQG